MGQFGSMHSADEEGEFQQAAAFCFDAISSFDAAADSSPRSTVHEGKLVLCREDWARLYGLYKVAVVGPCNIERPSSATMQYGWHAWRALSGMEPAAARRAFVRIVWGITESAQTGSQSDSGPPSADMPELEPFACFFCGVNGRRVKESNALEFSASSEWLDSPDETYTQQSPPQVPVA